MASIINSNIASLNAQRNLMASQSQLSQSLQRLSSGLRVNSAKDDAAGLAIATRMTAQSRGMQVGIRNANDAISLVQTAEAGMNTVTENLQRMRELAVQAASGQYSSGDRAMLDAEYKQLGAEVNRAAQALKFNNQQVVWGTGSTSFSFQVGSTTASADTMTVTTVDLSATLSAFVGAATSSIGGSAAGAATAAMAAIDTALDTLNTKRADLGSFQSRLEGIISVLSATVENTESAKSRIMDADYAEETAKLSRGQILQQAGTAMLAQANAIPQNVLSLLR